MSEILSIYLLFFATKSALIVCRLFSVNMFESSPEISFNVKLDSDVLCSMLIEYIKGEKDSRLSKDSLLELQESFNVVDQSSKSIIGSLSMILSPKSKNMPKDFKVGSDSERTKATESQLVEANDSAANGRIELFSMLNNLGKPSKFLKPQVNETQEAAVYLTDESNQVEEEEVEMKPDVSSLDQNLHKESRNLITDRFVETTHRRSMLKKSIRQSVICGNPNKVENSMGNVNRARTSKQKTCAGVAQTQNMVCIQSSILDLKKILTLPF